MPIAPYPYKITCIKRQIATEKIKLTVIDGGGPIACEKHQKELQKKLRNRESALQARERKKQRFLELERDVKILSHDCSCFLKIQRRVTLMA